MTRAEHVEALRSAVAAGECAVTALRSALIEALDGASLRVVSAHTVRGQGHAKQCAIRALLAYTDIDAAIAAAAEDSTDGPKRSDAAPA